MNLIRLFIIIIMLFDHKTAARKGTHKLIYQKDISEHCRRRVFPSIFLGRQVVKANSQILQFSRLELPYSCFISIRTESGSNMIMMIQLASHDLKKSCSKHSEQLLVYEIGETFGGYWGPLPDSVMRQTSLGARFYTIKTTHPTTSTTETSSELETEEITEELDTTTAPTSNETEQNPLSRDYVEVEVPIVNVSVHLVPGGQKRPPKPIDQDVAFDLQNDVTPIAGESYDTRMLPLVQFSIREEAAERRVGDDDAPRYELDIAGDFTPDMRLTWPQLSSTKRKKPYYGRKYQVTRRLNFKKHKNLIDAEKYHNRQIIPRIFSKYEFPTKKPVVPSTKSNDSWRVIEDMIKKLEGNVKRSDTTVSDNAIILEKIANLDHNISAYLLPHWSHRNDRKTIKNSMNTRKSTTLSYKIKKLYAKRMKITSNIMVDASDERFSQSSLENTEVSLSHANKTQDENSHVKTEPTFLYQSNSISSSKEFKESDTNIEIAMLGALRVNESTTTKFNTEHELPENSRRVTSNVDNDKSILGSMVNHESWENLVQAAPEMAIKLNQTVAYDTNHNTSTNEDLTLINETRHQDKLLRKKKEIHSIYIENARPHSITPRAEKSTTTVSQFQIADMHEFAQLVELQDNELHGRVALRYLRQYVGPSLYNLCDLAESTQRHVHLFNSSRIVLAISNFTLERMVVILTSARTLLSGESRCPTSHLECQVSGARVCLDSMVACDGVPNCGSYDIYDEDRLLCGAPKGLRHNVYLAAFTFLAVLLTALYAVHYWLKRCVPKVADAFFVYTNGIENILFLDTIMRSPNDTDDISKMVYHSTFFGDDNIYDELEIAVESNACKRFIKKCCFCFFKKHTNKNHNMSKLEREEQEQESFTNLQQRRLYSFTYSDVNDMFSNSRDTAIQTGSSLEMQHLEKFNKYKQQSDDNRIMQIDETPLPPSPPILIQDSILTLEEPLPEEKDEISLMKFFRAARKSDSIVSVLAVEAVKPKVKDKSEVELKSYNYDSPVYTEPGPSGIRTTSEKKPTRSGGHKHLRFDDVTTTIPFDDYHDDDDGDHVDKRRSVQLVENKSRRPAQLDTIEEDEEQNTTLKDTFHFWGTSKLKKSKKKLQYSTR